MVTATDVGITGIITPDCKFGGNDGIGKGRNWLRIKQQVNLNSDMSLPRWTERGDYVIMGME